MAATWIAQKLPEDSLKNIQRVFQRFELPFKRKSWRSSGGEWLGETCGGSLEFYDHRAYALGDDPRGINWNIYARTDHYVIKRFRAENQPLLDLVLDGSASMFGDPEKATRALELLEFCRHSARRCSASTRLYLLTDGHIQAWPHELPPLRPMNFDLHTPESVSLPLTRIPWRNGSLRIFISDLLFPEAPEKVIQPFMHPGSLTLFWSPVSRQDYNPEFSGNLRLRDRESGLGREGVFYTNVLDQYRKRFRQHEENWMNATQKRGIHFARLKADHTLETLFQSHLLPSGSLEWRTG